MRFWRRPTQARECVDYSAVANAVRKRHSARNEMPCDPDAFSPSSTSDVRAYRPEDRLLERDAQARKLIENARDIPRTWEEDVPPSARESNSGWVGLALWNCFLIVIGFIAATMMKLDSGMPLLGFIVSLAGLALLTSVAVFVCDRERQRPELRIVETILFAITMIGIFAAVYFNFSR